MPKVRGAIAALLILATARDRPAWGSGAPLDLLRPGSHAAVGLGGDPFLSPLADQVGWWSRLGLGADPGSRVEFDASRPADLGGGSGFESSRAAWTASTGGRLARGSWTGGLGIDQPRWQGGWVGGRGGLSLRGSGAGAEAGIRMRMLPEFSWQVAGGASDAGSRSGAAWGAGVRYQRPSGTGIQGSWQRSRRPDELRSTLYDEPIVVAANLVHEGQRLDGRLSSWLGASLEGTLARTRWLSFDAAAPTPLYHFAPAGTSSLDQAGLRWSLPRSEALVRWTRHDLDLEGNLSWWGQSFGGIDYARATLESWLSAFQVVSSSGDRTLLELERVRLGARARGAVESWPFTSTLVDLLGQRRIFRLEGTVGWERWHVAHARALAGRALGRAGAEWIDLRPAGRLESWRPAFLVFGKEDDQVDALNVRRVQLAVLSLGASISTAAADLDLGLEQCVWARVRESRGASGTEAGPASPSLSVGGTREGAGTRVRLAISRRF